MMGAVRITCRSNVVAVEPGLTRDGTQAEEDETRFVTRAETGEGGVGILLIDEADQIATRIGDVLRDRGARRNETAIEERIRRIVGTEIVIGSGRHGGAVVVTRFNP